MNKPLKKVSQDISQLLIELETQLRSPEVRSSKIELDKLLADDFIEFGSSGKIFNKQDILNRLTLESSLKITASDFKLNQLSDNVIQLTYKSHSEVKGVKPRYSLRSSIWRLTFLNGK